MSLGEPSICIRIQPFFSVRVEFASRESSVEFFLSAQPDSTRKETRRRMDVFFIADGIMMVKIMIFVEVGGAGIMVRDVWRKSVERRRFLKND
jgi:hypothetical protein